MRTSSRPSGLQSLALALALAFLASVASVALAAEPVGVSRPEEPPKSAHLVYSRGDIEGCPDEDAMKARVSAHLGYDPFKGDARQVVTASIARRGAGLRADVTLRSADFSVKGSRVLTSDVGDCVELAQTVALAVSIAIDPLRAARAPDPTPAPSPPASAAPPAPSRAGTEVDAPEPAPAPPSRTHAVGVRAGVDFGVAFGETPGAAPAPGIFAGFAYDNVSLDFEGRGYFATSVDAAPTGRVRATLLKASVFPCLHAKIAMGCVSFGVGRLEGTGEGVDVPASEATLYVDAGVRFGVEIPFLGPLSARLSGDVVVPLVATKLTLRGAEVWASPPLAAAAAAGVVARFP